MDPVLIRLVALTALVYIPAIVPPCLHQAGQSHEVKQAQERLEDARLPERLHHSRLGRILTRVQRSEQRESTTCPLIPLLAHLLIWAASNLPSAALARLQSVQMVNGARCCLCG